MKKRRFAVLLAAGLAFASAGAVSAGEPSAAGGEDRTPAAGAERSGVNGETDFAEAGQIVIYHTNDSHGYLSGDGEEIVGIDQVAGLKRLPPVRFWWMRGTPHRACRWLPSRRART